MSEEDKRELIENLLTEQCNLDDGHYDDIGPNPGESDVDIFSPEVLKQIEEAKRTNKPAFQSYWEADEEDVSPWTDDQIAQDPAKQLISHAENGELDAIKALVATRTPLEIQTLLMYKDSDGYTAMHRACYSNHVHIIEYLMTFENNKEMPLLDQLNARTEMGWTPLHSAVYWNNFKSVEYLLSTGTNVNVQTTDSGQTCLHLAGSNSTSRESLLLLLTHPNIDYHVKNSQGETASDIAKRLCKFHKLFEITEENFNIL
jgi:hypothetical protein